MPTWKSFAWINFREWPGLNNVAWIYFSEDRDFEKYFSQKKNGFAFDQKLLQVFKKITNM